MCLSGSVILFLEDMERKEEIVCLFLFSHIQTLCFWGLSDAEKEEI